MSDGPKYCCIGCHRWYPTGDVSHRLRNNECVCVGCASADDDAHSVSETQESQPFNRRYES